MKLFGLRRSSHRVHAVEEAYACTKLRKLGYVVAILGVIFISLIREK
jgi:hypothetical protein